MRVKDLQEVLKHFTEDKYKDYNIVFWDSSRQERMDASFTGLSHPDKEISFNVWDEEHPRYYEKVTSISIPNTIPSPFKEGEVAELYKEENYEIMGVKITRYFYKDPSGHQFSTTVTDTFTMCEYYCKKMQQYREKLKENNIPWD